MSKKPASDPFSATPKKSAKTRKQQRAYIPKERPLPQEHEPATTVTFSLPTPETQVMIEETKILPVKIPLTLDDRLEIAAATEAIKRRRSGQRKFSKTALANEAMSQWLERKGY